MPDDSFPVPNLDFLKRAIQSLGRTAAAKRPSVVAFLRKRAKALGATALLKKGALAMSNEDLMNDELLLAGINEAIELAGALPTFAPATSSSDGPRVSAQAKLGLKSGKAVGVYAKLRKKGIPHSAAHAAAKKVDSGYGMSNSPKA
jgi:hypothetical protein